MSYAGLLILFILPSFTAFADARFPSRRPRSVCRRLLASVRNASLRRRSEISTRGPAFGPYSDEGFRALTATYGNPPLLYSYGQSFGAVPNDVPLFRGVAGPDHDLDSIAKFLRGNRRFEPMSPDFKRRLDKASQTEPFDLAYDHARRETAEGISSSIEESGLEDFAFAMTSGSSAGRSAVDKTGSILKFTNDLNSALNYAGMNFEKNLRQGNRVNPAIFDASGNGGMTFGHTEVPNPAHYHEYDFLSNVSIRHLKGIYIGLTQKNSATVWEMPWIKITPVEREANGAFRSFTVDLVDVERKRAMEIYERTNIWPEYELTNLVPRKHAGLVGADGTFSLSPGLSVSERSSLAPIFAILGKKAKTERD